MNLDLSLGAGLDKPSFFEVAAHERVVMSLHGAFEHAITVSVRPILRANSANGPAHIAVSVV